MNHGPVVFFHQVIKRRLVARRHAQHDGGIARLGSLGIVPLDSSRSDPASGLTAALAVSQGRIVQDEGCHIFWNPILVGRLR